MKTALSIMFSSLLCLAFVALPGRASAVKYMKLEEAVKRYVPKGSKIVKIKKKLSAEQRQILIEDYGWTPKTDKYTFYVGKDAGDKPVAYVMVVPEIFGTCYHKYAVGMKADGEVKETVIVELSCPRAMPINRKGFLKQFRGKEHKDPLTIKADVDAVTGATLSSESTAQATRKAVSLHHLFFGGGERIAISDEVKRARAEANAAITKAVESGELMTDEQKAELAKKKATK